MRGGGAIKVKSAGRWTGPRSETALHIALQNRQLDLVKLLIEHGADTLLQATIDGEQRTCKELARGLAVEL